MGAELLLELRIGELGVCDNSSGVSCTESGEGEGWGTMLLYFGPLLLRCHVTRHDSNKDRRQKMAREESRHHFSPLD